MALVGVTVLCVLSFVSSITAETTLETSSDTPSTFSPDTTPEMVDTTAAATSAPALRCYNCKFTRDLRTCHFAKACPTGSSCLTGQLTSGLYYLDCVPSPACVAIPTMVQTQGTATFLGHNFQRFDCCTTSKCNRNIHVEQDTPSTFSPDTTPEMVDTTAAATSAPALRCYNCKFTRDLRTCHFAKACPTGSSCLTGQLTSGLYYLDCVPSPACVAIPTMVQTQGTATFLGHNFQRFDCCTTSKCNRNIHVEQGVGRR